MEEGKSSKKRQLPLDMNALLDDSRDDLDPPQLLIVNAQEPPSSNMDHHANVDDVASMPDAKLERTIERLRKNIDAGFFAKLPDRGQKFIASLKRHEKEYEQRKLRHANPMASERHEKPRQSMGSCINSTSESVTHNASFHSPPKSIFAARFIRKIEENKDYRVVNASGRDFAFVRGCGHKEMNPNVDLPQRERQKGQASSTQSDFRCGSSLSRNVDKHFNCDVDRKGVAFSMNAFYNGRENFSRTKKNCNSKISLSSCLRPRKDQTVILSDDEDIVEITEQAENLDDESMKDAEIFYPSKSDSENLPIAYRDIKCLAPEAYLTSTIMNFYILYLQRQVSPRNAAISYYHFCNTFFYPKIKEAATYQGNEKEFLRCRRWWKDVNVFKKSYIFIPIHEDVHWSLVIICIPDKEEVESGPIILHLDSLGLHSSKMIFGTIRSFLKQEWSFLNTDGTPTDVKISDKVWSCLPRKINEKIISVPQQKNDSDCGLFVLFFMERFIEEAPESLRKEDLDMFGKKWFRPEEASGLRRKIKNLLMELFKNGN